MVLVLWVAYGFLGLVVDLQVLYVYCCLYCGLFSLFMVLR